MENDLVQLDVAVLTRLVGVVIPIITAIITTKTADAAIKSLSTTFLSIVAGGITAALATQGVVDLTDWIAGMFWTFVTATAAYYGFWKPTGIAAAVQEKTRNFGIGAKATTEK